MYSRPKLNTHIKGIYQNSYCYPKPVVAYLHNIHTNKIYPISNQMIVTDIPCGHFTLFLSLFLWHHVYNRMNLCCGEKKTSSKHTLNKYLQTYPPKNRHRENSSVNAMMCTFLSFYMYVYV